MGRVAGVFDNPPGFPCTPPGVDILEGGKLTSNNVAGSSHDPLQSQVGGGAGNGGLAAGYPRLDEPSLSARRRRSIGPSTKEVQYHRMAPQIRATQLVEDRAAVCPGTGPRCFFFFFLSLLGHSSSFRLLFSRLVCPYPQVRRGRPDGLPPGGGEGGVERSLVGTPRPARGDGGM